MAKKVKGTLQVSAEVIADLAGYAALSCYGVVGMAPVAINHTAFQNFLQFGQARQGVEVEMENGAVEITLHVVIDSGVNMRSVSENLQSSVEFMLQTLAEIEKPVVNVIIESIKSR